MIVFNKKICIVLTSLFLLFLCMSTVCSTVIHHPIYTGLMDEEYNYTDDLIVHNETCCNLTPGYAIRNFTPEPITDIDEQFYRCGADDYPFTPILIEGFPIKQVNSTQKLHGPAKFISNNNNTKETLSLKERLIKYGIPIVSPFLYPDLLGPIKYPIELPIKQVNSTPKSHESTNISTNNNTNYDIDKLIMRGNIIEPICTYYDGSYPSFKR